MANTSDFLEAPTGADAKYTEINLQRRLNEARGHIEELQNTLRLHLAPAMKADCQLLLDFYKAGAANIEAEVELHKLRPMIEESRQKVEGVQKWITASAGSPVQRQFVQEQDRTREQLQRLEQRKAALQAQIQQWREVEYPQWDKACQEARGRFAQHRGLEASDSDTPQTSINSGISTVRSREAKKRRDTAILSIWSRRKKGDIDYEKVCGCLDKDKISVLESWPKKTWMDNLTNSTTADRVRKYIHDVIRPS